MSVYQFAVGRGRVGTTTAHRVRKIARPFGVEFINAEMPDGWRYWFARDNDGAPFNEAARDAVLSRLREAGLDPHALAGVPR